MELYIGLAILTMLFMQSSLIGGLVTGFRGERGGSRDALKIFSGIMGGGGQFGTGIDRRIDEALNRIVLEGQAGGFSENLAKAIGRPFGQAGQQNLAGVDQNIGQLNQIAGGIRGQVQGSALASTRGAQLQAIQAARLGGGGRGGLAFGGGAAQLAARAGQQAGTQQSAALSQALLQGTQLQGGLLAQAGQLGLGAAQGRLGIAQGLSGAALARAQLTERSKARLDQFQMARIQAIAGVGTSIFGQGLQGTAQRESNIANNSGISIGLPGGVGIGL